MLDLPSCCEVRWITSSMIHILPAKNRSVEPKEELNANKFLALFQSHFAGHVSRIHSQNIFKFTFLDFFCLSSTTTRPPLLWSIRIINCIDFIHFCGSQEIHLNIIIFHTKLFIITQGTRIRFAGYKSSIDILYRVSRINFYKTVRPAIRPNFPKAMQTLPLMFSQSIATKITKGTWHSARRKRSGERRTRVQQRMAMGGNVDNRVGEGDFTVALEKIEHFLKWN